jgi:hypothetical protein
MEREIGLEECSTLRCPICASGDLSVTTINVNNPAADLVTIAVSLRV